MEHGAQQDRRLVNVKRLTLYGFDLSNLFAPVLLMLDTEALTYLTLWKCDAVHVFMHEFVRTSNASQLKLENLAIRLDKNAPESIDGSLKGLFGMCSLLSLHLTWDNMLDGRPAATLADISYLAPTLLFLSFYDGSIVDAMDHNIEYLGAHFGESLGVCSKLQQFGF
ncbi:hypothetical protein K491DRAFT_685480 [Lophiostoma macrostomum CBS 122681]|uniref:Uncharacterized protein n=1 Tax=Lophiostoma macrostomum CBS 122681 TaxID=1314788 RepID=A0A6A6SMU0_9PLEO|nr:hypothetical protein K491DRAFT_685480 [Lophiostoma macrostomum CBS 122681]